MSYWYMWYSDRKTSLSNVMKFFTHRFKNPATLFPDHTETISTSFPGSLIFQPPGVRSTAVKRPKRFSFYLVGFYLMLSGNMGKDV